jgi:Ca-activated chloride channel family protein
MNVQFASPALLFLLLIVPILVGWYFYSKKRSKPATMIHTAASMVANLPVSWRITMRPVLLVMGRETITGEGVEIVLALDISGSMASLDFEPDNRLQAAKQVITDFIQERPYDKIGLVVFASEAFSQTPLTVDHQMLDRGLNQIELATDLGIEDGTAIGLGLANAANMLAESKAESRVLILLTDGVNNAGQIDPLTAAEAAKALGIKVYTIGAARPGQVPVPVKDLLGGAEIVYQESELDEGTLQQVAEITGGKYYRAENTAGLKAIYDEINSLEKSQIEVQVYNQYFELLAIFLFPALLIILLEIFLRNTIFRKVP